MRPLWREIGALKAFFLFILSRILTSYEITILKVNNFCQNFFIAQVVRKIGPFIIQQKVFMKVIIYNFSVLYQIFPFRDCPYLETTVKMMRQRWLFFVFF